MSRDAFLAHFAPVPQASRRVDAITFTPSGCWEWPSKRYGYVFLKSDGHGGTVERILAHRLSLQLRLGRPLRAAPVEEACHHCDNPPCANPDHLFLGSHLDNVRDCIAKGRDNRGEPLRGEANPRVRHSDAEVRQTLADLEASGLPIVVFARSRGIAGSTIHNWMRGTRREARTAS